MELRTHAQILKRSRWFVLIVTVLAGVVALLFALYRPVQYQAVVNFDVTSVSRPDTTEYQYGSYYELKASEIFVQHLMSWFKTPAVVAEVYDAAEVGYEINNIGRFTNRFKTSQYSAQNFAVSFSDLNRETATKLAGSVASVIEGRALNSGSIGEEQVFQVIAFDPVVAEAELSPWLITIVGLIAGALLSIILVYLREYFRE